jgi:hypothetical protein
MIKIIIIPKPSTFTETRDQASFSDVTVVPLTSSPKQTILFCAPFFYRA